MQAWLKSRGRESFGGRSLDMGDGLLDYSMKGFSDGSGPSRGEEAVPGSRILKKGYSRGAQVARCIKHQRNGGADMKFFVCEKCGNFVEMIKESGAPMSCCGQKMTELVPGTSDGAVEKHVPEFSVDGNKVTVKVGSVEHPMVEAHYIEWIAVETKKGVQRKALHPDEKPCAEFVLTEDDSVVAVYAYCNLHGLWKAE